MRRAKVASERISSGLRQHTRSLRSRRVSSAVYAAASFSSHLGNCAFTAGLAARSLDVPLGPRGVGDYAAHDHRLLNDYTRSLCCGPWKLCCIRLG